MAMKPAGKAIVAAVVVLGAIAGAHFGGVFDKLKKQGEATVAVQPASTQGPSEPVPMPPERTITAPPEPAAAPASTPQPVNSPVRQSDAFDQLIRQSGAK